MGGFLSNIFNPNPFKNPLSGDPRAVYKDITGKISDYKSRGQDTAAADDSGIPDYLDAYQKGVDVDTATLQKRRLMDAAAQLGGVYYDGRIMSQDEYNRAVEFEQNKIAAAQASGDTHSLNEAQTELAKLQGKDVYNFKGAGSADLAQQQLLQEIAGMDQTTRAQLDLEKKYGTEAAGIARDNIRAIDPTGFDLREQVGANLASGNNSIESLFRGQNAPKYEQIGYDQLPQYMRQSMSDLPNLRQVSERYLPRLGGVNGVNLADTGAAAAGRADLERSVFDQLSQVGQSDPALQRSAEQAARARGAASGNILGDGSALNESLAVQLAQRGLDEKRREEALNLLSSGQTTSDKDNELQQLQLQNDIAAQGFNNDAKQTMFGNRTGLSAANNDVAQTNFANKASVVAQNNTVSDQAFNSVMAALGQRNQAAQNSFTSANQLLQQQANARQQDMANQQSYLGLQPVSAQAGGYQNISAPFNPGNVQNGVTTDPAAGTNGAQWYAQLYGNQQQSQAADSSASAAKKSALISGGAALASAAIIAI